MIKFLVALSLAASTFGAITAAEAETYPDKPIRMVLAYPPGGSADPIARALGAHLAERLGQSVIVDNKPGGNTIIATQFVAKAAPDGYTLYHTLTTPYTMVPYMYKKIPYDAKRSNTPIAVIGELSFAVTVPANSPYKNLKELIDAAKAAPGKLSFPSTGTAQVIGLASELFKSSVDINALHVPYSGAGPAITALLSGQHDFYLADIGSIAQYAKANKVRLLAVLGNRRHPEFPEVPTITEAGFNDVSMPPVWMGIVGPPGMPPAIVEKLNNVINQEMKTPEMVQVMNSFSLTVSTGTPRKLEQYLQADDIAWGGIIRKLNVQLD
jgi:tripartite-type tricarboxylate transporter receptor subunit TctC